MMRMHWPFVLLLALGCSGDDRSKIIRIVGEAYAPLEALEAIKGEYEAATGITIQVEKYDFETAIERVAFDLVSRSGHYDIVLQPHMVLGRLAAGGHIMPLAAIADTIALRSPEFDPSRDLFAAFWRDLAWYGDSIYGYPFTANTMYVWYRADLFDDAASRRDFEQRYGYPLSAPATWTQYRDIAEFFTRPRDGLYGTTITARRHPSLWYEWLNVLHAHGGRVFAADDAWSHGPITVACSEAVEATQLYRSLLAFAPPGALEATWDEALAAFQQGRVAMGVMWSDAVHFVEDPDQSRVAGLMRYTGVPRQYAGPFGQIAGWSFLIPRSARNRAAAIEFIKWMMKPETQIRQQLLGGASAVRAVYADRLVQRLPYTEAYVTMLEAGTTMSWSFPETVEVSDALQVCLSDIMVRRYDVDVGLDACASAIAAILGPGSVIACGPGERSLSVFFDRAKARSSG